MCQVPPLTGSRNLHIFTSWLGKVVEESDWPIIDRRLGQWHSHFLFLVFFDFPNIFNRLFPRWNVKYISLTFHLSCQVYNHMIELESHSKTNHCSSNTLASKIGSIRTDRDKQVVSIIYLRLGNFMGLILAWGCAHKHSTHTVWIW